MPENQSTISDQRHQVVVGAKIGRWTVVGPIRVGKKILCECDCGKHRLVDVQALSRGGSLSCGCSHVNGARLIRLEGERFGKLVALRRDESRMKPTRWICRCDCGKEKSINADNLRRGLVRSCGCLCKGSPRKKGQPRRPSCPVGSTFGHWAVLGDSQMGPSRVICQCVCGVVKEVGRHALESGESRSCGCKKFENCTVWPGTKHGLSGTHEHGVWSSMKERCLNENCKSYRHYGGRGIKVCDRWLDSFEAFLEDMGTAPPGMTIERNNVNGDYEPGNCRWATAKEQGRNKRSNVVVEYKGEQRLLIELVEETGVPYLVAYKRIKYRGWTAEQAVSIPIDPENRFRMPRSK